ncbi:hypothetical protein EB796_017602 [Bugula neritina]|uniref:RWD domain-containing protein n=1 Tax=Bugula neritina TaxID=10212 RepID=A0A7J7JCW0_BUGNE|nr:hypothetical protein EB796_017602 [Bugula neritina]
MTPEECKEEQMAELEALESIYIDELEVHTTEPYPSFTITISSQGLDDPEREQDSEMCELMFTFTPQYPEEGPEILINFETEREERIAEISDIKDAVVEESLGMSMVFTIVSAITDKLNEYFDENTRLREDAAELAIKLAEEAERKKFEGTKCTVENFMAWKLKFDEERQKERKAAKLKLHDASKLTGYELFMIDKTLDESDLQLLDPGLCHS